jgi:two-component system, chemotaxis family, CheB/CheR fusion protein
VAQENASRGVSVLVVEDEADVRELIVQHLSDLGCNVHAVSGGPDAVVVLHGEEPVDLLVTDVIMPGGMTGYGIADAAVAVRPGIKVMFVSGYAGTGRAHGHQRHPTAPMLHKPFQRNELLAAVHQALA